MRRTTLTFSLVLISLSCWVTAEDCREALRSGVELYKQSRYAQAALSFKAVTASHSSCENAWLYLATSYAQQYIPGADEPENNRIGNRAIRAFETAIELNPNNTGAKKGIAYIKLQMKSFEEAKEMYGQAETADPSDPELPYSIGVIDWTMSYQPRMEARAKLGLKPTDPLNDLATCNLLRSKSSDVIDDGIAQLRRALKLRPDYDDAMAYMNLLYREKAELECESPERRQKYFQIADRWVDRTMEIKRRKVEQQKLCEANAEKSSPCYQPDEAKD